MLIILKKSDVKLVKCLTQGTSRFLVKSRSYIWISMGVYVPMQLGFLSCKDEYLRLLGRRTKIFIELKFRKYFRSHLNFTSAQELSDIKIDPKGTWTLQSLLQNVLYKWLKMGITHWAMTDEFAQTACIKLR